MTTAIFQLSKLSQSQLKEAWDQAPDSDPANDGDYDVVCHEETVEINGANPPSVEIDIFDATGFRAVYGWRCDRDLGSSRVTNESWSDSDFEGRDVTDSAPIIAAPRFPVNPWEVSDDAQSPSKLKVSFLDSNPAKVTFQFYGSKKMPS